MIQLTKLDGMIIHLNPDILESIEETPDTHITLTNGNRYLVLDSAASITEKIISFKARILRRASPLPAPKYVRKLRQKQFSPFCSLNRDTTPR